ncbi:MAG: SOS response-associated peptidase [Gammaproteobacteria bacterium]|nr:SOS response-associated peptidase [Gammaproteobacteria bacterium]
MCGRFTLHTASDIIAQAFDVTLEHETAPRYNIAPSQPILGIRLDEMGRRVATFFRWGLVPFWAKDASIGNKLINARAETVDEKPSFRASFRHHRCLVVADGYYEWHTGPDGKQPYYITPADPARPLMAFGGLFSTWHSPDGSELDTAALLTCAPNNALSFIHDRMPVIIEPDNWQTWLDPRTDRKALKPLLGPVADDRLTPVAVSKMVNTPRNDDARCIEPVADGTHG